MSIFDSIKYPISTPPARDEFLRLPDEIFKCWIDHHTLDWCKQIPSSRYDKETVFDWYEVNFPLDYTPESEFLIDHEIINDLRALRKLILEWET